MSKIKVDSGNPQNPPAVDPAPSADQAGQEALRQLERLLQQDPQGAQKSARDADVPGRPAQAQEAFRAREGQPEREATRAQEARRVLEAQRSQDANRAQDPTRAEANREVDALLRGERPPPDVQNLRLTDRLADVRERFTTDFARMQQQLLERPDMHVQEKAQRAFELFTGYAARFVQMKTEPQKLPPNPNPDAGPEALRLAQQAMMTRQAPVQSTTEGQRLFGDGNGEGAGRPDEAASEAARAGNGAVAFGGQLPRENLPLPVKQRLSGSGEGAAGEEGAQEKAAKGALALPTRKELRAEVEAFANTLQELQFNELRDVKSGKDGLQIAYEMLNSGSLEELASRAKNLRLASEGWQPPKARKAASSARPLELADPPPGFRRELGDSPPELSNPIEYERTHGNPQLMNELPRFSFQPLLQPLPERQAPSPRLDTGELPRKNPWTDKRLGPQMLWNVLHRFRGQGPDTADEKANWGRVAFLAIGALVVLTCIVVVLVNL